MIGARLINDDDPTCRKLSAKCIKEMITRIPSNEKNKLFDIALKWLSDSKVIIDYDPLNNEQISFFFYKNVKTD